jgi:hypothetical protein
MEQTADGKAYSPLPRLSPAAFSKPAVHLTSVMFLAIAFNESDKLHVIKTVQNSDAEGRAY